MSAFSTSGLWRSLDGSEFVTRGGHWSIGLTLVVGCAILWVASRRREARRRKNLPLPPGPRGLPIIGNALQIPLVHPWLVYNEWKKEYGDLIYLEALGQKILILNSLESIEALLVKRGTNYSDRASTPIIDLMRTGWSFSVMNYGQEWLERRRLFHRFFHHSEGHHPVVEEETFNFLRKLVDKPTIATFREEARTMLAIIIMRLTYGATDAAYNRRLIDAADEVIKGFVEYSSPGRLLVHVFPVLRHVPSWLPGAEWKADMLRLAEINDYIHDQPFDDAIERVKTGTQSEHSLATLAIQELPEEQTDSRAHQEQVARDVAAQAYTAGADTTFSSACALVLALAMHPDVQRKAQEEIDAVVGSQRLPTCKDLNQLPYIQAVVKEVSRWHTVGPLSLPHASKEDDEYNGYFIPAKTVIFPNTWAVLHDPDVYPEPHRFDPERFLKDGKINPEVRDPDVAVFGYGRRICPGRNLSNDTFALLAARLLACFDVKPSLDETGRPIPLKLEVNSGFIATPLPFDCQIIPRSQQHAELLYA
ncbi:cytochrome P450 [Coprinopsis cinerea okayama7|uniref:Cytochrome P450 n=1 Tax=Coprinopsis cinerea (strain Okayama-7 / 130 / ATCC MYA-4618 / FGSC 9003) TaxID=240176 RepID=A8NBP8_COPC7|nr:cytochrome P450 [Coprinopsis cinerea okayama7\|eukprot:XP_001832246.2 cytochrome P450 [Coprinopsis cinerea okayama7\